MITHTRAAIGGLVAALLLPLLFLVGPGDSGGINSPPPGKARGDRSAPPLLLPGQTLPPQGLDPATLTHLPMNRRDLLPNPAAGRFRTAADEEVGRTTMRNCYPRDHAGWQENPRCVDPNYQKGTDGSPVQHWGVDPYNGGPQKWRYVYVVDEMEGTRASEWLAWHLNNENATWNEGTRPWRPHYVYFSGSWLRAQAGYEAYADCRGGLAQFIEFCLRGPNGSTSYATWNWNAQGHYITGDAFIGSWSGNDMYVGASVLHEFGHLDGLAHTDECGSVMTYCTETVGIQYLFYSATDRWVKGMLYDYHQH